MFIILRLQQWKELVQKEVSAYFLNWLRQHYKFKMLLLIKRLSQNLHQRYRKKNLQKLNLKRSLKNKIKCVALYFDLFKWI